MQSVLESDEGEQLRAVHERQSPLVEKMYMCGRIPQQVEKLVPVNMK